MAAWTFSAVPGATAGSSLTTRETVFALTPASFETSCRVGRFADKLHSRGGQLVFGAGRTGEAPGQLTRPPGIDPAGELLLDGRGGRGHREDHRVGAGPALLERLDQATDERVAGPDRVDDVDLD